MQRRGRQHKSPLPGDSEEDDVNDLIDPDIENPLTQPTVLRPPSEATDHRYFHLMNDWWLTVPEADTRHVTHAEPYFILVIRGFMAWIESKTSSCFQSGEDTSKCPCQKSMGKCNCLNCGCECAEARRSGLAPVCDRTCRLNNIGKQKARKKIISRRRYGLS